MGLYYKAYHSAGGCDIIERHVLNKNPDFRVQYFNFPEDVMRALFVILLLIGAVGFVMGCGSDTTEVAWKNSTASTGSVQEIVWADGDVTWNETVAKESTSSSKEVSKTDGAVECAVYSGADSVFDVATDVRVNDQIGAISLNEGESQVLTLQANR